MKKPVLIAFAAFLLSGLCVTAVEAQNISHAPGCNTTGPNGGMWGALTRHADAVRVRNRAYAREIFKQPDSSLALSCFDHALALSSRLGLIFSDVYLPPPPATANTSVFGAVAYSSYGSNKWLVKDLSDVISAGLKDHAASFEGAPSKDLGGTNLNWMEPDQSLISQVNGLLPGAPGTTPALTNVVAGGMTSMAAYAGDGGACARIAALWGNTDPVYPYAVEGSGIEDGAPYFTYAALVSGKPGSIGPDMKTEFENSVNAAVLMNALADISSGGALSGPTPPPSIWPTTPVFPANSKTEDIISQM